MVLGLANVNMVKHCPRSPALSFLRGQILITQHADLNIFESTPNLRTITDNGINRADYSLNGLFSIQRTRNCASTEI